DRSPSLQRTQVRHQIEQLLFVEHRIEPWRHHAGGQLRAGGDRFLRDQTRLTGGLGQGDAGGGTRGDQAQRRAAVRQHYRVLIVIAGDVVVGEEDAFDQFTFDADRADLREVWADLLTDGAD